MVVFCSNTERWWCQNKVLMWGVARPSYAFMSSIKSSVNQLGTTTSLCWRVCWSPTRMVVPSPAWLSPLQWGGKGREGERGVRWHLIILKVHLKLGLEQCGGGGIMPPPPRQVGLRNGSAENISMIYL